MIMCVMKRAQCKQYYVVVVVVGARRKTFCVMIAHEVRRKFTFQRRRIAFLSIDKTFALIGFPESKGRHASLYYQEMQYTEDVRDGIL